MKLSNCGYAGVPTFTWALSSMLSSIILSFSSEFEICDDCFEFLHRDSLRIHLYLQIPRKDCGLRHHNLSSPQSYTLDSSRSSQNHLIHL